MGTEKSVGYFAAVDQQRSKGVIKKINNTITACKSKYPKAEALFFDESTFGIWQFTRELFRSPHHINFVRYTTLLSPSIFIASAWLRLKGKKVIVDVPTPRIIVWKEVVDSDKSLLTKIIHLSTLAISMSWIFFPANLVVQYADESNFFSFGVGKKSIKIGNGVVIKNNMPLRKAHWPSKELVLIGVARLAYWHGFDRILRAIYELNKEPIEFTIRFKIVGEGNDMAALKKAVEELQLQKQVEFTGILDGPELNQAFEDAHIGIASLGLYRKNLTEASDLKTREYMSRGFSVIAAGKDIDFPIENPFRIEIPNDNSLYELKKLLRSYSQKRLPDSEEARQYAQQHLSLKVKINTIFSAIEC